MAMQTNVTGFLWGWKNVAEHPRGWNKIVWDCHRNIALYLISCSNKMFFKLFKDVSSDFNDMNCIIIS